MSPMYPGEPLSILFSILNIDGTLKEECVDVIDK